MAEQKPSIETSLPELKVLETLQERLERSIILKSAAWRLKDIIRHLMIRWFKERTTGIEGLLTAEELPELVSLVRTAFRTWASRESLDLLRRLEKLAQDLQVELPVTSPAQYEADFAAWAQQQATMIRLGLWEDVDQENVAEELEGLSRSDHHELEHRLEVLTTHLLKWQYRLQYPDAERGWRLTIVEQRRRLSRLLHRSPSLGPTCPAVFEEIYPHARLVASIELGFPDDTALPPVCPWTVEQALDPDFWPEPVS